MKITKELLGLFRYLLQYGVSLSELLQEIRFSYCLSYRQIADIVELSPQRICDIIKGRSNIKEETYLRILYHLDTKLNLNHSEVKRHYAASYSKK
ncbi:hypothetical protein [Clostridium celatum]|uniref:Toxin-antitoxin system, antitoxin component, Xre domain protein n=1 Tax=Clostridium celatum DSM 1785 TaxID=545697 RepID=L1QG82_9CLOT|nr:hypothetical protein [Clostridium celatum]EKY27014.1 toxin-antitoxin system, antitoxin component, Xre domain protein [Clostridium celatum DSM 1785]MCE9654727.1 hypothetical protein [Clostridium celatum]